MSSLGWLTMSHPHRKLSPHCWGTHVTPTLPHPELFKAGEQPLEPPSPPRQKENNQIGSLPYCKPELKTVFPLESNPRTQLWTIGSCVHDPASVHPWLTYCSHSGLERTAFRALALALSLFVTHFPQVSTQLSPPQSDLP